MNRNRTIIRTSIIGILANILLAAFKAAIGMITHSIAITMDAVNNLSDAMSSVVTIIGTKLAHKQPDRDHPWGHGRAEYLSAMVISVIILYAGITSLVESVKKIIYPETPDYSVVSLAIIAVATLTKIILGIYVKKVGESVNSEALEDSGKDALMDAIISASTIAAALVYIGTKLSIEAYLGAIIAMVIVHSGVGMLRSTISELLGQRIDRETAVKVRDVISGIPEVHGVYDMIFHDYGPDHLNCSAHIEVDDTLTAEEIDFVQRRAANTLYNETGIILTALSVYAINTTDEEVMRIREEVYEKTAAHPYVLEVHGFFLRDSYMQFDVIVSFDAPDRTEVYRGILEDLRNEYPDYDIHITLDTDFSVSG